MESTETRIEGRRDTGVVRFTPNDSMESTETARKASLLSQARRFTPNDSMESTETHMYILVGRNVYLFHPQRLDGEY